MTESQKQGGDEGIVVACRVCMETFATQEELAVHMKEVHGDEQDPTSVERVIAPEGPQRPRFKR